MRSPGVSVSESEDRVETATEPDGPTGQTILVTGGAGFIGSHLAASLAVDNTVTVLDNCSNGREENVPAEVEFRRGDIRDRATLSEAMTDVDLVYHQAGMIDVAESVDRPVDSHETNVAATVSLLDLARTYDARVVLASSCAIYGDPASFPIDETTATRPQAPYGVDKLAIDHYARVFAEQYGLRTVVLRYFNVYGPRQASGYSGVIDAFLSRARNDEPLTIFGDGSQTRDFVHVSDVVRANLAAGTTTETGTAFNVGTGEETRIDDLAEMIRDLVDADSSIECASARPGDIARSCADLSRSRSLLGYEPRISLDDGLRTLIDA
ncbi:NAD-dependent epimerase/dehydratase family protein (plasmid) [Haloferacaceae archaeon DSL9]